MNRIFIAIIACFVAFITVLCSVLGLDYVYKRRIESICGLPKVREMTESKQSSFVEEMEAFKTTKLEDEKELECEESKDKPENEPENKPQEKPEEKPQEKPEDKPEKDECNEIVDEEIKEDVEVEETKPNKWNIQLGEYEGLTYYSQIDERWKDKPYTSTGNSSQTIGSSGCGPTVAAMIVSSIKGNITPEKMAEIFVEKGYRSPNNGTYWSAYRDIADVFDIEFTETNNFDKALELLRNNYYIIVSCGNGLFTTNGHFIVLVGIEGNTLKIFDPYLYNGKFNIPSRRDKVVVEGNTVYCTINNFRKYANYRNFFCYKNS